MSHKPLLSATITESIGLVSKAMNKKLVVKTALF